MLAGDSISPQVTIHGGMEVELMAKLNTWVISLERHVPATIATRGHCVNSQWYSNRL